VETLVPNRGARLRAWFRAHRPAIVLVALAITIPELLTGSTPVVALANPLAVAGLLGFYGAGALAIRETAIAWRKGWVGVLLLGLAYGVAEEGIATKTMVDPQSAGAGYLAVYGHFLGVNWVFAVVIALFHALFSIALPILLVDLIYPSTRGRRFLSNNGVGWAVGILSLSVAVGYFGFDAAYFEGFVVLGFLLMVVGALVVAARVVPEKVLRPRRASPDRTPRWFAGLGVAFAFGWSFLYLVGPRIVPVPAILVAGELGISLLVLYAVILHAGRTRHEPQQVYFAAGLLSWYLPWDVVVTFLGDYLVLIVLSAVFALLIYLAQYWNRVRGDRGGPSERSAGPVP
jgi:hypothetical protein